jgi:hypothetical protein
VTHPDAVAEALAAAFTEPGPMLLDVVVDGRVAN